MVHARHGKPTGACYKGKVPPDAEDVDAPESFATPLDTKTADGCSQAVPEVVVAKPTFDAFFKTGL